MNTNAITQPQFIRIIVRYIDIQLCPYIKSSELGQKNAHTNELFQNVLMLTDGEHLREGSVGKKSGLQIENVEFNIPNYP